MKKRICFLIDSIFSIGGVQRVTAVIAKALAQDDYPEGAVITATYKEDDSELTFGKRLPQA